MKETKRKGLVILVAILIVGVVGLGLTYAYWTLSFTQENSNFVTSDCFHITFDGKNDINIQKAYPMSDEELYAFYESATPYHFVIENTCDAEATAIINLETISHDNKLADEYIETILYNGEKSYLEIIKNNTESKDIYSRKKSKRKYTGGQGDVNFYNYQLTNNPANQNKVINNALTAYKLYEFKFNGKGKREFNLLQYMYQEASANENTINKTFESKITVTTAYKPTVQANTLASRDCTEAALCIDETRVFQTNHINNTTKIVFQNRMNPPTKFEASFDESEGKDGSVKAYVVQNEDDATYTIYFQTNGNFAMKNGTNYFRDFSNVTTIEGLEYLDTSQAYSLQHMFYNMNNLTSLDLSNFDTSKVTSMGFMFSGMRNLTSLDLGSFDTSNVTNMQWMFRDMNALKSLDLSSFDTSKVTNMSYMFSGMSLTSLDLRHFDTSQVKDMSGMFNRSALTELNLNSFDTRNVTNMGSMFGGMSSLTSLDLSSFDTSNVKNMREMFSGMRNLTSLNVSNLDTSNVANMYGMFNGMSSLTSLDLSNFATSNVTSMNGMFWGMISLTELNLGSFDTRQAIDMSVMFANTPNLSTITYGNNFIRKEEANITNIFDACPANKPTHPSWDGAFTS